MPVGLEDQIFTSDTLLTDKPLSVGEINKGVQIDVLANRERGVLETVGLGAPLVASDLVDSVASSLSLGHIERGTVNQALLNAAGSPNLRSFYEENKEGIELGSGVAGLVASVYPAGRILKGAEALGAARNASWFSKALTLDAQYANALNAVRVAEAESAGIATIGGMTAARAEAGREFSRIAMMRGLRAGVAQEAVLAATMNQNEFLFSDSVGSNLAWSVAGLGLGVGIEKIVANAALRKVASEQLVMRRHIDAFDPEGQESRRLGFWQTRKSGDTFTTSAGAFDDATSLLVEREQLRAGSGVLDESQRETLIRNRESFATTLLSRAREKIQYGVSRGLPHDGRTRIHLGKDEAANHVEFLMSQDPSAFTNMRYLGKVPDELDMATTITQFQDRLVSQRNELTAKLSDPKLSRTQQRKIQSQLAQLEMTDKATIVGFVDGERVPVNEALVHAEFAALPKAQAFAESDGLFSIKVPGQKKAIASIDSDLRLVTRGGKPLDMTDFFDVKRVYELGEFTAKKLAAGKEPIHLGEKPNWFQLDLAERILQISNDPTKVSFPAGMTRDSAKVESFAQKIEALRAKPINPLDDPEVLQIRNRIIFNLPRQTSAQQGLSQTSEGMPEIIAYVTKSLSPNQIRQMTSADIEEFMTHYQQIGGYTPDKNIRFKSGDSALANLSGNSFTTGLDDLGRPMPPLIGVMDPIAPHQWSLNHVAYRIGQNRAAVNSVIGGPQSDEFTKTLYDTIVNNPETQKAFSVNQLRDTQLTSLPESLWGQVGNKFLTPGFVARDSEPVAAMIQVRDTLTRVNNGLTDKYFTEALGDALGRLGTPRNRESKLLLDSYFSFGRGWDMQNPVKSGDHWVFPLADTAANRAKYQSMLGERMPEGAVLQTPKGVTVVVDDLGRELIERFESLTTKRRDMANTLLAATGKAPIGHKNLFVPSPQTRGKYVGFTFDPYGNQVVGSTIIAETPAEYAKKLQALESELEAKGPGYRVRRLDDIQEFGSIFDRVEAEWMDPGHALSANKTNKGLLIQNEIEIGAFQNALESLRDRFYRHTDDVLDVMFKDSFEGVKSRIVAANEVRPIGARANKTHVPNNVYQRWLDAAKGRQRINSVDSYHARVSQGAEGLIDSMLKTGAETKAKVTDALNTWWARANPLSDSAGAKRDFETLSNSLGKLMPVADHEEWLRVNKYGAAPVTARELQQKTSAFTSAITLRVMETAHSLMTMGSLVANMPAVMRQLSQHPGESLQAWRVRTKNLGTQLITKDGEAIGLLDMTKVAGAGIKAIFDPEFAPVLEDMAKRGMTSQEVAEFTKQLAVLNPRTGWAKHFLGDSTITNPKTIGEHLKAKGVVGGLSILTDSAENFSRMLSSATGYKLAESIGLPTHEAKMLFAHKFANNVIADYNPLNRAEIFQGPFGGAVGLFKTFITNYYQRLFGYVETKNWGSLASQFVAQGALFGVPSVPGWTALDSFSQAVGEGDETATDKIADNTAGLHDLMMGGAIASLPKLFGAPAMSIYTRGDTNLRVPNMSHGLADVAPAVSVIGKMADGLVQIGKYLGDDAPKTTQRMGELLSNFVVNRTLGGQIEIALAGGYDTDRVGHTVSIAQSQAEKIYRLMGMKSMGQEELVRAYYRSKPYQEQQAALQSQLRYSMRAAIRNGQFEELLPIFRDQYIERGGDIRGFRRAVTEAKKSALDTKAQRAFDSALKKSTTAAEIQRYMSAGIETDNDDAEEKTAVDVLNSIDGVNPEEAQDPSGLSLPGGL